MLTHHLTLSVLGLFVLSFTNSHRASGQVTSAIGAESIGLGQSRTGPSNVWSVYNNPANMVSDTTLQLGLNIDKKYGIDGLHSSSLATIFNQGSLAVGAYYHSYGYRLSHQSTVGLGAGIQLQRLSRLGVSLHRHREVFAGQILGKGHSISFGLTHIFTSNTTLHLVLVNPFVLREDQYYNSSISSGAYILVSDQVSCLIQATVSPKNPFAISAGIRYQISKAFVLLVGVRTNPTTLSFGFVFQKNRWQICHANVHHYLLGFSPNLSAQWNSKN